MDIDQSLPAPLAKNIIFQDGSDFFTYDVFFAFMDDAYPTLGYLYRMYESDIKKNGWKIK